MSISVVNLISQSVLRHSSVIAFFSRACFGYYLTGIDLSVVATHRLDHGSIDLLRSRLLRRTSAVYSPTSQPFSACNCRQGYYLLGNLPNFLCCLCLKIIVFPLFVFLCSFFPRFFVICTSMLLSTYSSTASTAQHSTA